MMNFSKMSTADYCCAAFWGVRWTMLLTSMTPSVLRFMSSVLMLWLLHCNKLATSLTTLRRVLPTGGSSTPHVVFITFFCQRDTLITQGGDLMLMENSEEEADCAPWGVQAAAGESLWVEAAQPPGCCGWLRKMDGTPQGDTPYAPQTCNIKTHSQPHL